MSKPAEAKAKPKMILGDQTFWVEGKIGVGGYASVYRVTSDDTGKDMVIKRMECKSDELEKMMDNEFDVLRLVRDVPSCARIYGLQKKKAFGGWEYRVLMENCPLSLISVLQKMEKDKLKIPESGIWEIMYDITSAISFLHKQKPAIAHRDLKLENILLSKDNTWKLIDFGSCKKGRIELKDKKTIQNVEDDIAKTTTQMYRAPELIDFFGITYIDEKVDIWALGCILYTLLFMKQPFQNFNKLAILGGKYPPPPRNSYSSEIIDLLNKMLTPDQVKRISAADALKIIKAKVGKRSKKPLTWLPKFEDDKAAAGSTSGSRFRDSRHDDDDDEMEFIDEVIKDMDNGKKKKSAKKSKFVDSDEEESEEELPKKKKSAKKSKFVDEDSEEELPKKKSGKKSSKFVDEDSDEEEEEVKPKKKTAKKSKKPVVSDDDDVFGEDDEEEEEEKPKKKTAKKTVKKSAKKAVSRDEDDDDDVFGFGEPAEEEEEEEEVKPKKKAAKKSKKPVVSDDDDDDAFGEEEEEEEKPKKKTAKKTTKKSTKKATTPSDDLDDLFVF